MEEVFSIGDFDLKIEQELFLVFNHTTKDIFSVSNRGFGVGVTASFNI